MKRGRGSTTKPRAARLDPTPYLNLVQVPDLSPTQVDSAFLTPKDLTTVPDKPLEDYPLIGVASFPISDRFQRPHSDA